MIVAGAGVVGGTALIALAGCGFDGAGTLDLPDAQAPAAVATADASSGATDAPMVLDAAQVDEGAPSPGPCDDPTLVLCIPFDGAALDAAHGQAIEVGGKVTYVMGVEGQAAALDATSAITLPHGPAWQYTSITIEMWARPDALPAAGARAGLLDKEASFGIFAYADGTVGCIMGQTALGKTFTTLGTWVHLACINDGASTTLYVDGAVKTTTPGLIKVAPSTALAAIGNNSPSLGDPWIGALDMLRVYARAKTAAEIALDAKR